MHQNSIEMVTKYFNIIPGEGSATLLLYGDIGDGYKVESGRIVSELIALQSQYGKIDVRINSRGGDVFSGMAIYNALRQSGREYRCHHCPVRKAPLHESIR